MLLLSHLTGEEAQAEVKKHAQGHTGAQGLIGGLNSGLFDLRAETLNQAVKWPLLTTKL